MSKTQTFPDAILKLGNGLVDALVVLEDNMVDRLLALSNSLKKSNKAPLASILSYVNLLETFLLKEHLGKGFESFVFKSASSSVEFYQLHFVVLQESLCYHLTSYGAESTVGDIKPLKVISMGKKVLEACNSLRSKCIVSKVEMLDLLVHDGVHQNSERDGQVFLESADEYIAEINIFEIGPTLKDVFCKPLACLCSV